ncbi:hypothetical protein SAMN05216389_10552 [Oceanobacillus limi]|uniref:Uncharacterized protein n=1 Tax=Oceanobacillus limi TaxID=930131 RepID=A0A1I0BJ79_9BACI|nr:hypothetical protein [Oceanobacillus limi]SET07044.1 hypothetical protein SAMN05216389_10552 [Oceanobacillus limi]
MHRTGIYFGLFILLFLGACDSSPPYKVEENEDVSEEEKATPKDPSPLREELAIEGLTLGSSYDEVVEVLGEPRSLETGRAEDLTLMDYENHHIVLRDDEIVGLKDERKSAKTSSGVATGDSVNDLLGKYTYTKQTADEAFYMYDDELIIVFLADGTNKIYSMELHEKDTYLSLVEMTMDELLVRSEIFETPLTPSTASENADEGLSENGSEIQSDSTNTEQESKDRISEQGNDTDAEKEVSTDDIEDNGNTDGIEDPGNTGQEEKVESSDDDYDPFQKQHEVAAFSKTVNIGDREEVVRDYMGEGNIDARNESITIYASPPIKFVAEDGVIKFISWGRSGSFEDWETKEGIGRRSTLEQAEKAYEGFDYKLLYREGLDLPSFMQIDDGEDVLMLEFSSGRVSYIFRCMPEMLDSLYVRNSTFYNPNQLKESPF